jgi:hypothetical protein
VGFGLKSFDRYKFIENSEWKKSAAERIWLSMFALVAGQVEEKT